MAEPLKDKHEQEVAVASPSGRDSHLTTRMCITCHNTFDGELSFCPGDATPLVTLDQDPLLGTMVGKYKILSVIGQGGMGVVYKAEQIVMQRLVALKMIRSGLKDSGVILRFQQEAKAVSALNHPNIVTVYECTVSEDGTPYLVMEYLDGKTLADGDINLNQEQAVDVFIQLCDALAHAHDQGVIHRDLKPGNIVFCDCPNNGSSVSVKILDFGIAKLLPSSGKQYLELTRTGQPIGSPSYMSPEQCRAEELDARSDIYSLGCVMYKILTGKPIFESESLFKVLGQHLTDTPPPFSQACPDAHIPIELEEIVFKALEKNRERRYQSMEELKQALEDFKAGHASAMQFLSTRMRRAIRYRRTAYIYLLVILIGSALWVAGIFTPQLREQQQRNLMANFEQVTMYNNQAHEKLKTSDPKDAVATQSARSLLEKAQDLEKTLPDAPDFNLARAFTLQNLGRVCLRMHRSREAESIFQDSQRLFSENQASKPLLVSVMQDIAEAKKRLGKFDEAYAMLQEAKALAKDDPSAIADCFLRQGIVKENQRDFVSSQKDYASSLSILQELHRDKDATAKSLYEGLFRIANQSGDAKAAALWAQKAADCR